MVKFCCIKRMQKRTPTGSAELYKYMQGGCPDEFCFERLVFVKNGDHYVTCTFCGQTFQKANLIDVRPICFAELCYLKKQMKRFPRRHGKEWTRVKGYSPFYCKIISPMFTRYGFDSNGEIQSWSELSNSPFLDCSILAKYAFEIEEDRLLIRGYGIDLSGSIDYLDGTLNAIYCMNGNNRVLVPLNVGGDGSCLVHAISRALVGREIFWHALRYNLQENFKENEAWYKKTLGDFIADDDYHELIKECDFEYEPKDARMGLRTAHIFGLAHVLYRPIILFDSMEMVKKSAAEFAATFLPIGRTVEECKDETGALNKPLVIAWANNLHNHFVPLVGVKGRPKSRVVRRFLPKAWCAEDKCVEQYITFENGFCTVASGFSISDEIMDTFLKAMDAQLKKNKNLDMQLICDYLEDSLRVGTFQPCFLDIDRMHTIYYNFHFKYWRCLFCWRLNVIPNFDLLLTAGGCIFETIANEEMSKLNDRQIYKARCFGINGTFEYYKNGNYFIPCNVELEYCILCGTSADQLRSQDLDGTIHFRDKDHSRTPAPYSLCKRKMKHICNGLEFDSLPITFIVEVEVDGRKISGNVSFFIFEKDEQRNSNIKDTANHFINAHCTDVSNLPDLFEKICKAIETKLSEFHEDCSKMCADPLWTFECNHKKFETCEEEIKGDPNNLIQFYNIPNVFRPTFPVTGVSNSSSLIRAQIIKEESITEESISVQTDVPDAFVAHVAAMY